MSKETPFKKKYYEYSPEYGEIYMAGSIYKPELTEHMHGFAELVCITKGCGIHTIDGYSMRTCCGDVFLIDYGMKHDFHPISEPFEWINCIFRPELLCDIFSTQENAASLLYYIFYYNKMSDPNAVTLNINLRPDGGDVTVMFKYMLKEYTGKRHGYENILQSYLMIILTKIARRIFSDTKSIEGYLNGDDIISDAILKLDRAEPGSISAKELADSYFLSQSSFSTKFKEQVGVSFLEYVTKLRMNRACELLVTSDLRISEIQLCAGYQDAKAFYRAFHKACGMTPTQYRDEYYKSEEKSHHE